MNATPIIELADVSVRMDVHNSNRVILDSASWKIEEGQHWAVLGPNGSGKTTLLKVASGYLWPSDGVVWRLGEEMIDVGTMRRSIGWITADLISQIPPEEIVHDTVVSGLFAQIGFKDLAWFQPTDKDHLKAAGQLELLNCAHLAERKFATLSQGEKQKTLIARARMAEPLLLILDEPCAGMDPGSREQFLDAIDELLETPDAPTTVLVTHHVEEILPSFENTLVMKEGKTVVQGSTHKVITADLLCRIYNVEVYEIVSSGGRLWPIWK